MSQQTKKKIENAAWSTFGALLVAAWLVVFMLQLPRAIAW